MNCKAWRPSESWTEAPGSADTGSTLQMGHVSCPAVQAVFVLRPLSPDSTKWEYSYLTEAES